MVIFMEGSQAGKVSSGHYLEGRVTEPSTDRMVGTVLQSLPFPLDRSLLYGLEELDLTVMTSGFFGDIFKAHHRRTDRIMVLKKDRQSIEDSITLENSLLSEAEILSQINHPNIVRFLGLCVDGLDNRVHLLIEHVNGGNLEQLLMNHDEVLDWGTRLHIARDIANGMSYLHQQRIIHRDLASKNCLIKVANGAKYGIVADLGLATHIPDHDEGVQFAVGSPYNMAPELLRGERYDNKADVFSYGIILCEIIGRIQADPDELPRTGSFGLDVEKFQTMVSDCPIEFLHTAVCCCQMDPRSRPSFSATVKHLEAVLLGFPGRPALSTTDVSTSDTLVEIPTNDSLNNNNWSSSTCSSASSQLLTPTSKESHRNRSNSDKRRLSWISGRYKLFHHATDDLLKHTPAKLTGFFKNVLGVRAKDHNFKTKKRSYSSTVLTRVSPLPTEQVLFWNENSANISSTPNNSETFLSKSCPGSPGTSGLRGKHNLQRHSITPITAPSFDKCEDVTDFSPGVHRDSAYSDLTSVSSGFESMHDHSSTAENSSCFTDSEYSSRNSSLRRDPDLLEDDHEDPTTTTCKNLKALHFDRSGSYSVINAETSYRHEIEREIRKEKLDGIKESNAEQIKGKRRMPSPKLFSFLLGNRSKSKDRS